MPINVVIADDHGCVLYRALTGTVLSERDSDVERCGPTSMSRRRCSPSVRSLLPLSA
jgi:hypothetical protein